MSARITPKGSSVVIVRGRYANEPAVVIGDQRRDRLGRLLVRLTRPGVEDKCVFVRPSSVDVYS